MEFVETSLFQEEWKALGFKDEHLRQLQQWICKNPDTGDFVAKACKIRKVRFAVKTGKTTSGKRGGARVIFRYFPRFESTLLLYVYSKKDKQDLTDDDKEIMCELIKEIEKLLPLKNKKRTR